MRRLNATVSPVLQAAIGQLIGTEGIPARKLVEGVTTLSRLFTKDRKRLSGGYWDDKVLRAAYLQYFMPVNLTKVQVLLDEMPVPQPGGALSVLDLGSGPGTAALAVLDWWHQRKMSFPLSMTAVDRSSGALRQARQLWDFFCRSESIGTADLGIAVEDLEHRVWLERVRHKGFFDLVILANCLNEVYRDEKDSIELRVDLVRKALTLLTPQGTIMIVEPALRETSRSLLQVRDRLVQEQDCTIYSPCLHEQTCPALINPDDWCHEERVWEPPAIIQQIDAEVGFIKDALKFSYLLLRKDKKTIVERRPDVFRVVSELRELKGEKRAWLCNEQGRQEVGRQDRLAAPRNEAFDGWHRGAIVQVEKIVHKERRGKVSVLGRIERGAAVQIVRPV